MSFKGENLFVPYYTFCIIRYVLILLGGHIISGQDMRLVQEPTPIAVICSPLENSVDAY